MYVKQNTNNVNVHNQLTFADEDADTSDNDNDEVEPMTLRIHVDKEGKLLKHTQIDNYIYRDHNLDHISFYEFVCCFSIEKQGKQHPDQLPKRLGTYNRYRLLFPHPLHDTHQIVQHTDHQHHITRQTLVPRVIGMSIPCPTNPIYKLFVLSHFKPFHNDIPLLASTETIENLYLSYHFPNFAVQVMKHWEAINECEDERDAERLGKRESLTRESQALTKSITANFDDDLTELSLDDKNHAKKDFQVNCELLKLIESKWLNKMETHKKLSSEFMFANLPKLTPQQMKLWKTEISEQENILKKTRHNALDASNQMDVDTIVPNTESGEHIITDQTHIQQNTVPSSEVYFGPQKPAQSREQLLQSIASKETLNAKQIIAFQIIAGDFLNMLMIKKKMSTKQMNQTSSHMYGFCYLVLVEQEKHMLYMLFKKL